MKERILIILLAILVSQPVLASNAPTLNSIVEVMPFCAINLDSIPLDTIDIKKTKVEQDKHAHEDSVPHIKDIISKSTDSLVGSIFGHSRQLSNADSIINMFDAMPSFGIYKDNYFIIGSDLFRKPDHNNSDAKFQVSIRNRLTNSTLPFKTYLFLTYSQKAFWDVFKESFPFRDLNYNPTIGIGRALVRKNRFLGTISFQFEHESNGKDGVDSRSWNKITFGSLFTLDDRWTFHAKTWIPIVDSQNNKDIVSYKGWGHVALDYSSPKHKYNVGCVITKRAGDIFDANIVLNASIRLFSDDNQYLFFEYYNGYGESMLDYKQYRQRFRIGIVMKANFLSEY